MLTIVGRDNNSGLTKDRDILMELFPGSQFRSIDDYRALEHRTCLFTEIVDPKYYGDYNILMPNQEWFFTSWIKELRNFQAIWVKTEIAYKIFKPMHPNVKLVGFTSVDMYDPDVVKKNVCFHAQGKSKEKGTSTLRNWEKDLPELYVISAHMAIRQPNVRMFTQRLNQNDFQKLANECLIHICPSTMEGYGHYINEAKSMGNVVVTTNSAPMNELIRDPRFLCNIVEAEHKPGALGTYTRTNYKEIKKVMKSIMKLNLAEEGMKNREDFLKKDKQFKETIRYEFEKI